MKEKVKKLWNKHKVKICVIGGVLVAGAAMYYLIKQNNKDMLDITGKKVISWTPTPDEGTMSIERVKEFLEVNKDNSSRFAVFREGPNPNGYLAILLSDDVIIP